MWCMRLRRGLKRVDDMEIPKLQTGAVANEKSERREDFAEFIAKKLPTGDKPRGLLGFGTYNALP